VSGYYFDRDGYFAQVDVEVEDMQVGRFYDFAVLAENLNGASDMSARLSVAVADLPAQCLPPQMVSHSEHEIQVSWQAVPEPEGRAGRILGYRLFMDNGFKEDFELVMDGSASPNIFTFTASDLVAGKPYRFKV
jgi:hypothetical protein